MLHHWTTRHGFATLTSLTHSPSSLSGVLPNVNSSAIASLLCPPTPVKFIKYELRRQPRVERMLQELPQRPLHSTNNPCHSVPNVATYSGIAIIIAFAFTLCHRLILAPAIYCHFRDLSTFPNFPMTDYSFLMVSDTIQSQISPCAHNYLDSRIRLLNHRSRSPRLHPAPPPCHLDFTHFNFHDPQKKFRPFKKNRGRCRGHDLTHLLILPLYTYILTIVFFHTTLLVTCVHD
jgi:hypothetical protein